MFRAFRCDDIATALHALIQRYSTHETFPLLVAIFAAWIAPQCGSVMAGDRLAAIFTVAFYPSAPYRRRSRKAHIAIAIVFLASRQFSIDRRPKPKNG